MDNISTRTRTSLISLLICFFPLQLQVLARNSIMLTVESFQAVNVAGPNMLAWLVWLLSGQAKIELEVITRVPMSIGMLISQIVANFSYCGPWLLRAKPKAEQNGQLNYWTCWNCYDNAYAACSFMRAHHLESWSSCLWGLRAFGLAFACIWGLFKGCPDPWLHSSLATLSGSPKRGLSRTCCWGGILRVILFLSGPRNLSNGDIQSANDTKIHLGDFSWSLPE